MSTPLPDGFTLLPGIFDAATSDAHLRALLADLHWEQQQFTIYGRAMPMPRLIAMYGPVGYRYSGVVHPPCPLPPRLDAVRLRVEEVSGLRFNSVLANLYRDGNDSVGWHRDSDYAHGGQPDIASVSFGATRRFEMRDEKGRERAAVELEAGSVLLMTGAAVARWWHRVAKTRRPVGPRVNLTFRHMVADSTGPAGGGTNSDADGRRVPEDALDGPVSSGRGSRRSLRSRPGTPCASAARSPGPHSGC